MSSSTPASLPTLPLAMHSNHSTLPRFPLPLRHSLLPNLPLTTIDSPLHSTPACPQLCQTRQPPRLAVSASTHQLPHSTKALSLQAGFSLPAASMLLPVAVVFHLEMSLLAILPTFPLLLLLLEIHSFTQVREDMCAFLHPTTCKELHRCPFPLSMPG